MNTLIFNGSPRPDGDTVALIEALTAALPDPADMVDCYRAGISPCVDCRACREAFRCVIDDAMQQVYRRIRAADAIVIASPIYYSQLTGPLLGALSRLQPGFYDRMRGGKGFHDRPRRGGILLVGGGDGSPAPALATARTLLHAMGCREIAEPVMSLRTDSLPAAMDAQALSAAAALGRSLGEGPL